MMDRFITNTFEATRHTGEEIVNTIRRNVSLQNGEFLIATFNRYVPMALPPGASELEKAAHAHNRVTWANRVWFAKTSGKALTFYAGGEPRLPTLRARRMSKDRMIAALNHCDHYAVEEVALITPENAMKFAESAQGVSWKMEGEEVAV